MIERTPTYIDRENESFVGVSCVIPQITHALMMGTYNLSIHSNQCLQGTFNLKVKIVLKLIPKMYRETWLAIAFLTLN